MTSTIPPVPTVSQVSELMESMGKVNTGIEASIKQTYPKAKGFEHTINFKTDGENSYVGSFEDGLETVHTTLAAKTLPALIEAIVRHFELT